MAIYERPDDYNVTAPATVDTTLTPFSAFEKGPQNCPLIIVNTPLDKIDIRSLWAKSPVQVCADGGANGLYNYFDSELREQYIPTFITGDCDSLLDHVRDYYVARGTILIRQLSQYSTDFMKAVKLVVIHCSAGGVEALGSGLPEMDDYSDHIATMAESVVEHMTEDLTVNIAGGIGGRFDQTFHSINQLYVMRKSYPHLQVFFFTSHDVVFLLPKGTTHVKYSDRKRFNRADPVPKCGLLPFKDEVLLTSEGLQYDVEDWPSTVGGDVSSSNGVTGVDGFWIKSSEDIVMSIEMAL